MSWGFATNPSFNWKKKSYEAQLDSDLIYEAKDGRIYVVPAKTYTDFASIPRFLWNIASPFDPEHRLPAVLHDLFYGLRGGDPYGLCRKDCDKLFLEAMESEGQSYWRRHTIYQAVRTFGGFHSRGTPWIV